MCNYTRMVKWKWIKSNNYFTGTTQDTTRNTDFTQIRDSLNGGYTKILWDWVSTLDSSKAWVKTNKKKGGGRQGWSIQSEAALELCGLTLTPTVRQLVEFAPWNGEWGHKQKKRGKQKWDNATHTWTEVVKKDAYYAYFAVPSRLRKLPLSTVFLSTWTYNQFSLSRNKCWPTLKWIVYV